MVLLVIEHMRLIIVIVLREVDVHMPLRLLVDVAHHVLVASSLSFIMHRYLLLLLLRILQQI